MLMPPPQKKPHKKTNVSPCNEMNIVLVVCLTTGPIFISYRPLRPAALPSSPVRSFEAHQKGSVA